MPVKTVTPAVPEIVIPPGASHDAAEDEFERQRREADEQTPQPSAELLREAAQHAKRKLRKVGCIHVSH